MITKAERGCKAQQFSQETTSEGDTLHASPFAVGSKALGAISARGSSCDIEITPS